MMSSARGATIPSSMWWSKGSLVAAWLNSENEDRNQTFSPVISDSVCTVVPLASIQSETRQLAEPPEPDSCGMVSAMRSSNAPAISAPLPLREQPVTPSRAGSIIADGVAAMTSMRRLTPQAQAIIAPAGWVGAIEVVERAHAARIAVALEGERVVGKDDGRDARLLSSCGPMLIPPMPIMAG